MKAYTKYLTALFFLAALTVLIQPAVAQEIFIEQPPFGPEPSPFGGEPLYVTNPGYEVLIVSGEDEFNEYPATPRNPKNFTVKQSARDTAEAYADAWQAAGYRAQIIYAPKSAGAIQASLNDIAARYRGNPGLLQQIAVHYYGHGADGFIKPTPGNRAELVYRQNDFVSIKVEVRIPHVSVGSAVAGAFPAGQFTDLEVVGVFDACRQEGALVDFRDAVLTGRSEGITTGITISSTRANGDANVCLAGVGIYSDAFLANLFGPSFDEIEYAHDATTTTQNNAGAAFYQTLGEGVIDIYEWFGAINRLR